MNFTSFLGGDKPPGLEIPIYIFKKRESLSKLSRITMMIWPFYLIFDQFYSIAIKQSFVNYDPVYLAYNYFISILILIGAFLVVWRFHHPIAQITGFILCTWLIFPIFMVNLQRDTWYFSPTTFILDLIMGIFVIFNAIVFVVQFFYLAIRKFRDIKGKVNITAYVIILIVLLGGMTFVSSNGFYQNATINDITATTSNDFKISFFTSPMAKNYSQTSIEKLHQLNSTFYPNTAISNNSNGYNMINQSYMYFDMNNLSFIPVLLAYGDYVDIYSIPEFNTTLDEYFNFLNNKTYSNLQGFMFDVESSVVYQITANQEQYLESQIIMEQIITRFRTRYPENSVDLCSYPYSILDPFDGDNDLQLKSGIITDVDWDNYHYFYFSFMDNEIKDEDLYIWMQEIRSGFALYGENFVPWVGWFYSNPLTNQNIYDLILKQIKIVKSLGIREVVIATDIGFLTDDPTTIYQRLDDLIAIKNGFEPFSIPYREGEIADIMNIRSFSDYTDWVKSMFVDNWILDISLIQDLHLGTPNNGYLKNQMLVLIIVGTITTIIVKITSKKSAEDEFDDLTQQSEPIMGDLLDI